MRFRCWLVVNKVFIYIIYSALRQFRLYPLMLSQLRWLINRGSLTLQRHPPIVIITLWSFTISNHCAVLIPDALLLNNRYPPALSILDTFLSPHTAFRPQYWRLVWRRRRRWWGYGFLSIVKTQEIQIYLPLLALSDVISYFYGFSWELLMILGIGLVHDTRCVTLVIIIVIVERKID